MLSKTETASELNLIHSFPRCAIIGVGKTTLYNQLLSPEDQIDGLPPKTTSESFAYVHMWCPITRQQTCKNYPEILICLCTFTILLLEWSSNERDHHFRRTNYVLTLYDMPGDPAVSN